MQLSHKAGLLCASALAALLMASRPAQALDFTFTYTTDGSTAAAAGQTVAGTLSGLVDGNNAGPGLIADLTQSPDPALDGTYTFAYAPTGDAFTVSGGNITFADAEFQAGGTLLFFGSDIAGGTFHPDLENDGEFYRNITMPDTFAPASPAAVPEPSTLAPFVLAGLGLLGLTLRARRKNKSA